MRMPIYLDYMATTPVDERVVQKMLTAMDRHGAFGNPASKSHSYGWEAADLIDLASEQVAKLINANAREVIWTSGATESNNLAIIGAARFYQRKGKHIITLATEHKAVLDVCQQLERDGFEVSYLRPESTGLLDLNKLQQALRDDTLLVSVMLVNNEIGVIQDIEAIGQLTKARGALFHVDAAQAAGKVKIDVNAMQIDLMSLSAHKVYGPKGIGALYVRRQPRIRLEPIIHGGGHQLGLRSGTLPTQQIIGMGEAFELARLSMNEETVRLRDLRDRLWQGLQQLPDIQLNGDLQQRVANNLNVSFAGIDGEALLLGLKDIAVSSGSACTSATIEPSHVLSAIGVPADLAHSSIRFALGRFTTEEEIDFAIEHVRYVVSRLRELSP